MLQNKIRVTSILLTTLLVNLHLTRLVIIHFVHTHTHKLIVLLRHFNGNTPFGAMCNEMLVSHFKDVTLYGHFSQNQNFGI